jgi:YD repeat-containing protein
MKNLKLKQSNFSPEKTMKFLSDFCFTFLLLLLFSFQTNAQYFYKDIWSNGQLMKEFSILKNENLKTVKIKSFEDDGEPSEGFFCEKKINKNYTQSEMISRSYITGQSLLISDYNKEGRPVKTTDNTPTTTSTTHYEYDGNGRLTNVQTVTKADDDSGEITETHEYVYNENSPVKMLCKKNNVLISTIHFVSDANGNVIEENAEGNNSTGKKYFYYYDDKNRLTDVVHFNERARRLLPDYMYEYNSFNQPNQMISTEEGGNNYFIWKYTYNDKNLRETEKCFSKEKRLLGTIEYVYK